MSSGFILMDLFLKLYKFLFTLFIYSMNCICSVLKSLDIYFSYETYYWQAPRQRKKRFVGPPRTGSAWEYVIFEVVDGRRPGKSIKYLLAKGCKCCKVCEDQIGRMCRGKSDWNESRLQKHT